MDQDPIIKQDYLLHAGQWADHTIDEAGFGTEGFSEIHRVTGQEVYRQIGKRYIDNLLLKFQREDGLWDRLWRRSTSSMQACMYHTRGLGWAMEGLLAAARMWPGDRYLELAKAMADRLIAAQHPEGYWSYQFHLPSKAVGVSEKGTALWSLLLYRLAKMTGESRYLSPARSALNWCMDNQYRGPDPDALGAIVGCSPQSAVVYRPWFRVTCAYTSAFFGLAILEELGLQAKAVP